LVNIIILLIYVVYLHFSWFVSGELCELLKINRFTIKYPNKKTAIEKGEKK